jgi:hypothetical protein
MLIDIFDSITHLLSTQDIEKLLEIEPTYYDKLKHIPEKILKKFKRSHKTGLWDLL